jgi:hypothetical protein
MAMKKTILLLAVCLTVNAAVVAQVKVRGGFLYDSIRIGEKTGFYLSAKYPSASVVLFPDSSHSYAPFEYASRKYFTTVSDGGITTDSAVYFVRSFDITPRLTLELPVYLLSAQDCTTYFSNPDSIRISSVSSMIPDTLTIAQLPLKIDTQYREVDKPLNVMIIFLIAGTALSLSGICWIAFGDRVTAYFAARKLRRSYAAFVSNYDKKINELKTQFSPRLTESAVYMWKRYMEDLESRPYTKLTTTETTRIYGDDYLGKNLKLVDRGIYADDPNAVSALYELKNIADDRYRSKLKEVTHGK